MIIKDTELRGMSIENARQAIVNNLILERTEIVHTLEQLDIEKAKFEGDLVGAGTGDTSENSAYDTAISNIATTQGRIFKYQQLQREMDLVTEPEYVLATSTYNFDNFIAKVEGTKDSVLISTLIYRFFNGDLNKIKTAPRSTMMELLKQVKKLIGLASEGYVFNEGESDMYDDLNELIKDSKPRPYVPCGQVVMYSVVRADINGEEYVFMICPSGISFVTEGIIACDTEIGKRVMGETVTGVKQTVRDGLHFTIKEIY